MGVLPVFQVPLANQESLVNEVQPVLPFKVTEEPPVNQANPVSKVLPAVVQQDLQVKQKCLTSKPSSKLCLRKLMSIFMPLYLKISEANLKELNTTLWSTTLVKATTKNKVVSSHLPTASTSSKPTH